MRYSSPPQLGEYVGVIGKFLTPGIDDDDRFHSVPDAVFEVRGCDRMGLGHVSPDAEQELRFHASSPMVFVCHSACSKACQ